jgi:hypothetical protein
MYSVQCTFMQCLSPVYIHAVPLSLQLLYLHMYILYIRCTPVPLQQTPCTHAEYPLYPVRYLFILCTSEPMQCVPPIATHIPVSEERLEGRRRSRGERINIMAGKTGKLVSIQQTAVRRGVCHRSPQHLYSPLILARPFSF